MRMKLRNVRKGDLVEKTFQANDRYQRARLDHRNVQFQYKDGTFYHFMDTSTYDQIALSDDQLGDATNYLTDRDGRRAKRIRRLAHRRRDARIGCAHRDRHRPGPQGRRRDRRK